MLSPLRLPTPKPLDVLFTSSKIDPYSIGSILLQLFADKRAIPARQRFSHVSIVLDGQFALEAMPGEGESKGKFTEATLEPGVRFIPLPDIIVPAWKEDSNFVVMRSQRADTITPDEFGLQSPYILEILGSAYSLEKLRESAEARLQALPEAALNFLRSKFDWKAPARDVGSRLVEREVRESLEKLIPGYVFPFKTASYFCSQLVADLLAKAGLLHFTEKADTITPTGLFAQLDASSEWEDVTTSDYSRAAIEATSTLSPATWKTEYLASKGEVMLRLMLRGIESAFELKTAVDRMMDDKRDYFSQWLEKLADPLRQIAWTKEAELTNFFADNLNLKAGPEREEFLGTARGAVRIFAWGGFSHADLFQALVKAIPKRSISSESAPSPSL